MKKIDHTCDVKSTAVVFDEDTTEKKSAFQKLLSRLFFCCIAIGLLWITTLDLAISIVQSSIPSPVLNSVVRSCQTAYTYVQIERQNYENCGDIQTQQCQSDFYNLYQREYYRSQQVIQSNQLIQRKVQVHQQICQVNLQDSIASLSAWGHQVSSSTQKTQNVVFYPSCSISDRTKVANLLGTTGTNDPTGTGTGSDSTAATPTPSSLKQKNLKIATKFTQSASLLLRSVVDYSEKVTSYNKEYLENHTKVTYPQLTSTLVNQISTPYLQYISGTELGTSLALSTTLKSTLASFTACVSLNPSLGKCTLIPNSVLAEYNRIQTLVNGNIKQMEVQIIKMSQTVKDYGLLVKNALTRANNYFDTVLSAMQWIQQNLIPLSKSVINICSVGSSSVSWCDFAKNDWYLPQPNSLTFPPIANVPNATDIWNKVSNSIAAAEQLLDQSVLRVNAKVKAWNDDLVKTTLNTEIFTPKDYHPPIYASSSSSESTPDEVVSSWDSQSKSYLSNLSFSYDELVESLQINKSSYRLDTNFSTLDTNFLRSFFTLTSDQFDLYSIFSQYGLNFASFSTPEGLVIASWFTPLLHLTSQVIFFDILWRILKSFRLFYKHWKGTMIRVPPVDLREHSLVDDLGGMCGSIFTTMMQFMSQLSLYVIFILVGFGLLLWTLSVSYLPMYQSYKDTCVNPSSHHQNLHNGTFISRNLYALGYNYASVLGKKKVASHLNDYNSLGSDTCLRNTNLAYQDMSQITTQLQDTLRTNQEVADNINLINSCVDLNSMDQLFANACCGDPSYPLCKNSSSSSVGDVCPLDPLTGFAYVSPGFLLQERYDLDPFVTCQSYNSLRNYVSSSLRNDTFSCSALPTCSLTCSGPNPKLIHAVTHHCSCMTEWEIHSTILQNLAAIVVYVLINLSRYFFYRFLLSMYWNDLKPVNSFEYLGSCSRQGDLIDPKDKEYEHANAEKEIDSPKKRQYSVLELDKLSQSYRERKQRKSKHLETAAVAAEGIEWEENPSLISVKPIKISMTLPPPTATPHEEEEKQITSQWIPKNEIEKQIDQSVQQIELTGYFYLIGAVIVNIPWILFLLFIRETIQYDSETDCQE